LYLLIEYLPGGELIDRIKNTVFMSENDTRFYLAEIVLAIESLHRKGIMYRDLKPENILLDQQGHIKLTDFGFAKCMNDIQNDRTFTNCGTPGYCAPEVMIDQMGYTYKADIWSIGILICEMLGGFTPFQNKHEAENPKLIMEMCRNGKLNLPKNLQGYSRDLVKSLLYVDPEGRPEIKEIKEHAFFREINWKKIKDRTENPPFLPGGQLLESSSNSNISK
jgi:serine/threonine protein kinase